ncbi:MAG: fumarate hydratase [Candidatus Omnitrophica bacterium]|nr:fumarate hydratase [Candidatus Omnitrophota bacterium]
MKLSDKLEKNTYLLTTQAGIVLRADVVKALANAYTMEKNVKAANAFKNIIDNSICAVEQRLAICQDTGMPIVFIEVGKGIKVDGAMVEAVKKGVFAAYRDNFFRPSLVDPLKRRKPSYIGEIPVYVEFTKKSGIKLSVLLKGFGSENKTKLYMLNPTDTVDEIIDVVVDAVREAGPESCPPFFLGIGIGGTSDKCLYLAKKALLAKMGNERHGSLAYDIMKKVNKLAIGPMGMGGDFTCLGVNVKTASTHIAGLPVGVNINCHALRSASLRFDV